MSETINNWMSWEGGVDLVAATREGLAMPNVIVHVARMVHTPVGSAPSGMVYYHPDLDGPPLLAGFISACPAVGAYFGPKIFAGTPFESAPALEAKIEIELAEGVARARVEVGGMVLETELSGLGDAELIGRAPAPGAPFNQRVIERIAKSASLKVNGEVIALHLPEVGISGGAPAVSAPCGLYAR